MPRKLTSATTLDSLRREAKRWLKLLRTNDPLAHARFRAAFPNHDQTHVLRDVQHALAREHGFRNWKELKLAVQQAATARTITAHEQAARDFVGAYGGDVAALDRLNQHYNRSFTLADLKAEIWR